MPDESDEMVLLFGTCLPLYGGAVSSQYHEHGGKDCYQADCHRYQEEFIEDRKAGVGQRGLKLVDARLGLLGCFAWNCQRQFESDD